MTMKLWLAGVAGCIFLAFSAGLAAQAPLPEQTTQVDQVGEPPQGTSTLPPLSLLITATAALGGAAFGIVEGLKWTRLGNAGFGQIEAHLGPLLASLSYAYGEDYLKLLRGKYKGNQQDLRRTLRQGIRIGLNGKNASPLAEYVGIPSDPGQLEAVAEELDSGNELSEPEGRILARFEAAVDARIDAALTMAQASYAGEMRLCATGVAVFISLATGAVLLVGGGEDMEWWRTLGTALLVGLAAVPIAPVAKDLVTAIQAASSAIRGRR